MTRRVAVLLVVLLVAGAVSAFVGKRLLYHLRRAAVVVFQYRARGVDYPGAVRAAANKTGVPAPLVRVYVPAPTYAAPCTEERRLWVKDAHRVLLGASVVVVGVLWPPVAPVVLAAGSGVDAAIPSRVVRPCRPS